MKKKKKEIVEEKESEEENPEPVAKPEDKSKTAVFYTRKR